VAVLRAGLPVEVGDDQRIVVRVVRETSTLVNTEIRVSARLRDSGVTIVGILRGEHMLAPRGDVVLLAGDRLILVAQGAVLDKLHDDLGAW
jgi:Trk K+ transport system NAD-binding subunit